MGDGHKSTLVEFIRYNNWANQQVIDACMKLSEEQLAAPIPGAYGSIRDTLEHIIRAEAGYVRRMTGDPDRLQPSFKWEDKPKLADMKAYNVEVGNALIELAETIDPKKPIYEEYEGQHNEYNCLLIFIQTIDHGVEHRTNITTLLNQEGLKPPDVDGWGYWWANQERFRQK